MVAVQALRFLAEPDAASDQGSGSTVRSGMRRRWARVGTRPPWTVTENPTMTKMTWYARAAPGVPEFTIAMPSRIGTRPEGAVPQEEDPFRHGEADGQGDQAAKDRADHERQQRREGEAVGPGGGAGELG